MKTVLLLGAAGRDFHNFNVFFRHNLDYQVAAFTATQIPDIAGRVYPPDLSGRLYPDGIPIFEEKDLEKLIEEFSVDIAVFSYSDISHQTLMHLASRVVAAGADFWLLGAEHTQFLPSFRSSRSARCAPDAARVRSRAWLPPSCSSWDWKPVAIRHPMPYGDLAAQAVQRFATWKTSTGTSAPSKSAKSTSRTFVRARWSMPVWTTKNSARGGEGSATSSCGMAATTTRPSTRPDLEIVVVDPHRPGHELSYYPAK